MKIMKQLFSILTAAVVMTACNSNSKTNAENVSLAAYKDSVRLAADTAGLAHYQAWKAQHELANASEYNSRYVTIAPAEKTARVSAARKTSKSKSVNYKSGSMNSESANSAKASQKKGWSKAAKGAAIGAGTGAVIGAVVHKKNRVAGGVVGGVVGAAGGYGIGRSIDKKDGRY
jgi:outer membrane biogenesis lipoprotein LolB